MVSQQSRIGGLFACMVICIASTLPSAVAAEEKSPGKPAIAVFDLRGELTEQPAEDQLPLFGPPGPWLRDTVTRLKKAADDSDVKAVVLLGDGGSYGFGQAEELRAAIKQARQAGKDVYGHSDSMMMGQYFLMSGVSRISVSPTGDLWVTGLAGDGLYLKAMLTKLGIFADFMHCGAYKSAAETFTRDGPSPEADEMTNWLLDSLFDSAIKAISEGRKVTVEQARKWVDEGPLTAEKAKAAGMIDAVESRADFETMLKTKYGKDVSFDRSYGAPKTPQLDLSNPFALFGVLAELMNGGRKSVDAGKPAVGVVYVDGIILLGRREAGLFGTAAATSTDVARALDKAAEDDGVKAVVLRVDSPGGSATASEIILRATERVKAKKPLVVSMGNVAGSGGYYVACASETIFADETTITGSIGVVGGKFVTTDMWNKIGVTWKQYKRGANAAIMSSDAAFSDAERQRLQSWMDDIYGTFKGHVTAVRGGRLKKPIDDIAGGRVYTGRQALDLGLVDRIGTLADAIAFAAEKAKLGDYDVRTVPEAKNLLQRIMSDAAGGDDEPGRIETAGAIGNSQGLMRLVEPLLAQLDPNHVRMLRLAMRQLQLVQREGVVLMMPAALCAGR